jgi:DNA-binding IclR family transcriptional regulator
MPAAGIPAASSVARILAIVTYIAESGGSAKIKQISEACGLPPSSVHRLLKLLEQHGWVASDVATKDYRIGGELHRVGGLIGNTFDLARLAAPHLDAVAEACDETVLLGAYLPRRRQMMFVARVDSRHALQYRVDMFVPQSITRGATGLSILAWLSEPDVRAAVEADATPGDPLDVTALARELASIRERGYAFTQGQRLPGATGIAAPVVTRSGRVVGNISLTIPTSRFDAGRMEEYVQHITRAAGSIAAVHP